MTSMQRHYVASTSIRRHVPAGQHRVSNDTPVDIGPTPVSQTRIKVTLLKTFRCMENNVFSNGDNCWACFPGDISVLNVGQLSKQNY